MQKVGVRKIMSKKDFKKNPKVYKGEPVSESGDYSGDPLGLDGFDHIEIYTSNAKQTAHFLCTAFGFEPFAYCGPETGFREGVVHVVKQGSAIYKITSSLYADSDISNMINKHGQTVKDVAFQVPDCVAFYNEAIKRGAESVMKPYEFSDENGVVRKATIKAYGDVQHSIIERKNFSGSFWPGFVSYNEIFPNVKAVDCGIEIVDHVVANVELGKMEHWVKFYEDVLGFKEMLHFTEDDISTEYSALMSKVMNDGSGKVKLPINEPADGKRKSQIEEYLEFHNGPGVQHIAMRTTDILKTITNLQERGVSFLRVPKTYYEALPERIGDIKEDLEKIGALGILADRDDDGYLLQIFTKPIQDRPTLFFEIIQREGSQGFGIGNFKALFEAIEREQERRGNL